jgi:hypothetical protein
MDKITHCDQPDVFEMKIKLILPPKLYGEGVGSVAEPWGKFKLRCLCNNCDLHTPVTR